MKTSCSSQAIHVDCPTPGVWNTRALVTAGASSIKGSTKGWKAGQKNKLVKQMEQFTSVGGSPWKQRWMICTSRPTRCHKSVSLRGFFWGGYFCIKAHNVRAKRVPELCNALFLRCRSQDWKFHFCLKWLKRWFNNTLCPEAQPLCHLYRIILYMKEGKGEYRKKNERKITRWH